MENNEFIGKLIALVRPDLILTKEDIENARIALIELKRSNLLRDDLIKSMEISLALYAVLRSLTDNEQQFWLELLDRAAKRRS